jgi:chemotaxis protein CheD
MLETQPRTLTVAIGDMKIGCENDVLVTYALGSCVGITMYDPILRLGALVHILLPEHGSGFGAETMKYADTAIPVTLRKLQERGFAKSRAVVKIAGGARMFENTQRVRFSDIGCRNVEAVHTALSKAGLVIQAEDTGGTCPRTMSMKLYDGTVRIRTAGKDWKYL